MNILHELDPITQAALNVGAKIMDETPGTILHRIMIVIDSHRQAAQIGEDPSLLSAERAQEQDEFREALEREDELKTRISRLESELEGVTQNKPDRDEDWPIEGRDTDYLTQEITLSNGWAIRIGKSYDNKPYLHVARPKPSVKDVPVEQGGKS